MTPGRHRELSRDPGLQAKVAFLRRADSYPERPRAVEALETHMSWVFLTDRHAYKLKKPVRHPFLDFTTLAARKDDCEAEVALNRRLAPDVYLDVVALTLDAGGRLRLEQPGVAVDWLVKMRRLARAQMLDERIRNGAIDAAELDPAALLLARFYAAAPALALEPGRYRERFEAELDRNEQVLSETRFAMPRDRVAAVCGAQRELLVRRPDLLEARVRDRRIVEGHGDLRPEHVFLGPAPAIIDCLEFDRELRLLDPAEELAFLAMECDLLGAGFVGRRFLELYSSVTGDRPAEQLLSFYRCVRACVRTRLSLWHVSDPDVADDERWHGKALRYLELAEGYGRRLGRGAQARPG